MCSKGGMAARGTAIRIAISLYARADEVGGTGFGKDDFRAWAVLLEVFSNSMEGPSSSYGATLEGSIKHSMEIILIK